MSLENPWTREGRVVKIETSRYGNGTTVHLQQEYRGEVGEVEIEELDYVSSATFEQAGIQVGDYIEFEFGPYAQPNHFGWKIPAQEPRALLARIEALEALIGKK